MRLCHLRILILILVCIASGARAWAQEASTPPGGAPGQDLSTPSGGGAPGQETETPATPVPVPAAPLAPVAATAVPDTTPWFRDLSGKDTVTLNDAFRAVLALQRGYDNPSETYDQRLIALLPGRFFRAHWDLLHGDRTAATRGQLAYMLNQLYRVHGGFVSRWTRRLWKPTERYAYRDLVDLGVLPEGGEHFAFTGRELLAVLDAASRFEVPVVLDPSAAGTAPPAREGAEVQAGQAAGPTPPPEGVKLHVRGVQGDVDLGVGETWTPVSRQAPPVNQPVVDVPLPCAISTGLRARVWFDLPQGGFLEITPLSWVLLSAEANGALKADVLEGGVHVAGGTVSLVASREGLSAELIPESVRPPAIEPIYSLWVRATGVRVQAGDNPISVTDLRVKHSSGRALVLHKGEWTDGRLTQPSELARAAATALYAPQGISTAEVEALRTRPYDGDPRPGSVIRDDSITEMRK